MARNWWFHRLKTTNQTVRAPGSVRSALPKIGSFEVVWSSFVAPLHPWIRNKGSSLCGTLYRPDHGDPPGRRPRPPRVAEPPGSSVAEPKSGFYRCFSVLL